MTYELKTTIQDLLSENGVQTTFHLKVVCIRNGKHSTFEEKIPIEQLGSPYPVSKQRAKAWVRNYMVEKGPSRIDKLKAEVDGYVDAAPEPVKTVESLGVTSL